MDGIDKFNEATVAFAAVPDTSFPLPLFHLAPVGVALDVAPVTDGKRLGNIGLLRLESTALFFDSGPPTFFLCRALLFLAHTAVLTRAPVARLTAVLGPPVSFAPLTDTPNPHAALKLDAFPIRSRDVLCCRAGIFRQRFTSTLVL
jgi:hypothetical protein